MWGKLPVHISESFAVPVRDVQTSRVWYNEKLGLRDGPKDIADDSGKPYVVLQLRDDELVTLVEDQERAATPRLPGDVAPIFFTGNTAKAHAMLKERDVPVEPIERDSGGNEFFRFMDLDGNRLEVCKEP
jgi:catechol 2,3-dioxygenase-like lactoylglutathione lyase family enzyme